MVKRTRKSKSPAINTLSAANKALETLWQGKAYAVKRLGGARPEIVIVSQSGAAASEVKVGAEFRYLFDRFLTENGNGDGLLPGCDQQLQPKTVPELTTQRISRKQRTSK